MTSAQDRSNGEDNGYRVVISGMSGLYPEANNVKEFADILYNKTNPMKKTDRWDSKNPESAQYIGHCYGMDEFDAEFFKVPNYIASVIDPMTRKLMEQAYQAVYDAGLTGEHLKDMKVGVYIAAGFSDAANSVYASCVHSKNGMSILGINKTMFANRISFGLNLNGPSACIDDACCGSLVALQRAYQDIATGQCDAALVGGSYLFLHNNASIHYRRLACTNSDGKTKCFDEQADGFGMSEAISILFLQKAEHAKRIYAEVVHVATEFIGLPENEFGPRFGHYRDPIAFSDFLKRFYKDANVSPKAVKYVEAFGSASPEADKSELETLDEVFCKDRDDCLTVGSVMSNIGFTEAATGACAITKIALGYHTGKIAGNLHCENPRKDIEGLRNGRMAIATDHKEFGQSYAAVNGISLFGVNGHVLLKDHYKLKDLNRYRSPIPHLVTISARLNTSVKNIIANMKSRPVDPEEIALLHNIHTKRINGHLGRGYVVLDTNVAGRTVSLSEKSVDFDKPDHPLWFVYSGMGSQWVGMGASLMCIPVFAEAIKRCHNVLKPKGIDIVDIITTADRKIFDNILHSFVGIAAIQIGLTDVLTAVELVPDKIIGHSVGELGCAYADGCFTAEEMILSAYSRGLVSMQTPFIRGSMAAVGLGYRQVLSLLPVDIEVACHNSSTSCTISGPYDSMKDFVGKLVDKGIFAKEVPCSEIAFHSRYIANGGPDLLKYLGEIITDPKPRSGRWVSTSIPQSKWNDQLAKTSSAEYHTNNLLSPVLFEETCRLIPDNAVLVEIAPHGLLQAILKRSLPSCRHISLTTRGYPNGPALVLQSIGKLFMESFNPNVAALYPKVEFPVSTGTPMLSHLVEWVKRDKKLPKFSLGDVKKAASCKFVIMIYDDEYKFLEGHLLRGEIHYPFAAALVAVWDTLAMSLNKKKKQISVKFSNLHLWSQPVIQRQRALAIHVAIQKGSGGFEVRNENRLVVTGTIEVIDSDNDYYKEKSFEQNESEDLTADDIYQRFFEKDMQYKDDFRSLHKANASLTQAQVTWKKEWVTFLDGVIQLGNLSNTYNYISRPCLIRSLTINIDKMQEDKTVYSANVIEKGIISCGGILLEDIRYEDVPFVKKEPVVLKSLSDTCVSAPESKKKSGNSTLQCARIGDLDSLQWVESPEVTGSGIPVNVKYVGLNTVDVKRATGQVKFDDSVLERNTYGMDFSGVTDSGARVMGLVRCGAARSRVRASPRLLWPVPEHWNMEDAATVPAPYLLALYCLGIRCELLPQSSILIHGGAGALGQAMLSIALAHGAQVYTTVSDQRKKQFLLKLFPELKEEHVGCSRDITFKDMVLRLRKGKMLDFVVSCVSGELKTASIDCGAITIDVEQIPSNEKYSFGMRQLTDRRSYIRVDFNSMISGGNYEELKKLHSMLSEGIRKGYVRPLTRVTYVPHEAPRAFRLLAASNHRGRALLRIQPAYTTQPRMRCSRGESQLVVCDDACLAAQWVDCLISRGASHAMLHLPNLTNYIHHKIRSWQELGVMVKVSSEKLKTANNIEKLIKATKTLAPLEGVYIVTINNGTKVDYVNFLTTNLDISCRKLAPSVKCFAVLNEGTDVGKQTCQSRTKDHFPAKLVSIAEKIKTWFTEDGDGKFTLRNVIEALERALCSKELAVSAHLELLPPTTLIQEIAQIAALSIPEGTANDRTLLDLGLRSAYTPALSAYLSSVHNIALPEKDLVNLTIKEVFDLEEYLSDIRFKDIKGFERFFTHFESDEMLATTDAVLMPTLIHSNITSLDDFDMSQGYLCIVPGLEGQSGRFRALCEGLKVSAVVLQPGFDHPDETIEQTAQRLVECVYKKLDLKNTKKHFYLLGYEAGIAVALEMARILESHGLSGTVFLLGGGWRAVRGVLEAECAESGASVEAHVSALVDHNATSRQHLEALQRGASSALLRALQTETDYRPQQMLIIRAADVPVSSLDSPSPDHALPTSLAHLAADLRAAAIVNSYLLPDDIEAYQRKNLCEAYMETAVSYT